MKGALEEAIKKLDFEKTYVFQSPFLIRQTELIRTGEKIGIKVLSVFNQLGLFKSQKPLPVSTLAQKMIGEISSESTARLNIYTQRYFSCSAVGITPKLPLSIFSNTNYNVRIKILTVFM
tara:strand:+ start:1988 stop:2347 length:360 start_codon:yes stop_codon:yes gene_type:complete